MSNNSDMQIVSGRFCLVSANELKDYVSVS
jgi:hypothetical protein